MAVIWVRDHVQLEKTDLWWSERNSVVGKLVLRARTGDLEAFDLLLRIDSQRDLPAEIVPPSRENLKSLAGREVRDTLRRLLLPNDRNSGQNAQIREILMADIADLAARQSSIGEQKFPLLAFSIRNDADPDRLVDFLATVRNSYGKEGAPLTICCEGMAGVMERVVQRIVLTDSQRARGIAFLRTMLFANSDRGHQRSVLESLVYGFESLSTERQREIDRCLEDYIRDSPRRSCRYLPMRHLAQLLPHLPPARQREVFSLMEEFLGTHLYGESEREPWAIPPLLGDYLFVLSPDEQLALSRRVFEGLRTGNEPLWGDRHGDERFAALESVLQRIDARAGERLMADILSHAEREVRTPAERNCLHEVLKIIPARLVVGENRRRLARLTATPLADPEIRRLLGSGILGDTEAAAVAPGVDHPLAQSVAASLVTTGFPATVFSDRALEASDLPPREGELVTILDRLGRGLTGEVVRVRTKSEKIEVMKLANPAGTPPSYEIAEGRFQTMRANQNAVHHPGVVKVSDLVYVGDRPCLVMEDVSGPDVGKVMASGALDLADAVEILKREAKIAIAAHTEGIAALDIQPGNMLLETRRSDDGTVRFIDLKATDWETDVRSGRAQVGVEISRSIALRSARGREGNSVVGMFLPAEALGGDVGPQTDIYAAGRTLLSMLAGTIMEEGVEMPSHYIEASEEIRREIDRIYAKSQAKVKNRYSTMAEFLKDLERLQGLLRQADLNPNLDGLLSRFYGISPVVASVEAAAPVVTDPTPRPSVTDTPAPVRRRNRREPIVRVERARSRANAQSQTRNANRPIELA